MNCRIQAAIAALVAFGALAHSAWAQPAPFQPKGTFIKYEQPLGHTVQPPNMMLWGEDIPSDFDWNKIMQPTTGEPIPPNWIIADDFRDEINRPVRTVKWWGSYFPGPVTQQVAGGDTITLPAGPGVEDAFTISFFGDIPANPNDPVAPFSRPDGLLGTYVVPFDKISVRNTELLGWDQKLIYEYEANLMDAHLDHPVTPYADSMGFNQRPGEVYWISIAAEVGHKLSLVNDPAGAPVWVSEDTGKSALDHFWGWHTSPFHFNDVATMGHLRMPGNQWEYGQWMPIQPQHGLFDMAFQLKTVPEPAGWLLIAISAAASGMLRRRRRG